MNGGINKIYISIIVFICILFLFIRSELVKVGRNAFIVYTQQNDGGTAGETINLIENYNFPDCYQNNINKGCIDSLGKTYPNVLYTFPDNRCVRSLDKIDNSYLTRALNKDPTLNLSSVFTDCSDDTNMFTPVYGRYVRIQNNNNRQIKIKQLEVYSNDAYIVPYSIHVNPILPSVDYTQLLSYSNTIDVETGISETTYIQLDLGDNYTITEIVITEASTDPTFEFIRDCYLYIIRDNETALGSITFQTLLSDNI